METTLTFYLKRKGMSVKDLAERTGLSETWVRFCLSSDTLPANKVVAQIFASAIDLPEASMAERMR